MFGQIDFKKKQKFNTNFKFVTLSKSPKNEKIGKKECKETKRKGLRVHGKEVYISKIEYKRAMKG